MAKKVAEFEHVEFTLVGEKLYKKTMVFYGYQAETYVKNYHFSKSILVANKFELQVGYTTTDEYRASLIQTVCNSSSEIIVICILESLILTSSILNKKYLH